MKHLPGRFSSSLAAVLLFLSVVGCSWVYDDAKNSPSLFISPQYSTPWMVRYPLSSYSQQELDSALKAFPSLSPELPPGLRAMVYRQNEIPLLFNLAPSGDNMPLDVGNYNLLFFNNGLTTVAISSPNDSSAISASVGDNMTPNVLFCSALTPITTICGPLYLFPRLTPLVWSYLITLQVDNGLQHVASASCSLSGMAASVSLVSRITDLDTVAALCTLSPSNGSLNGIIKSFGLPSFSPSSPSFPLSEHTLTLKVRLLNNKIITYSFPCSSQLQYQPQGGIIAIKHVVINPDDAKEDVGESGFDVSVHSWGPPIDIPVNW